MAPPQKAVWVHLLCQLLHAADSLGQNVRVVFGNLEGKHRPPTCKVCTL